jgi:RNA polymerase sigma-70 factor, ECF subfamily
MPIAADPQCDSQRIMKLVIQAKQGDTDAIGELYECHRLGIFRYLYYRTGDIQVADDLTSEVFLRMIRSLPGYRQQNVAFKAWLFQIAHNLLNDHYRKMSVRNHLPLEETTVEDPISPPTRPVERSLNNVTLQKALEYLPGEQRDVIVMRFITGMPISDVAQALHKSEDAVKGLQRRALANLRAVLGEWKVNYA